MILTNSGKSYFEVVLVCWSLILVTTNWYMSERRPSLLRRTVGSRMLLLSFGTTILWLWWIWYKQL